jgi:dTDP-4-amino-4,6-dideoxygalactose transaminase
MRVSGAAKRYTTQLKEVVATPVVPEGFHSSWAQYTLRLRDVVQRDAVQTFLKEKGIPAMAYYPKPMHLQTAFAGLAAAESCPVATRLCNQVLSLPMHPYITLEEIFAVCYSLRSALDKA